MPKFAVAITSEYQYVALKHEIVDAPDWLSALLKVDDDLASSFTGRDITLDAAVEEASNRQHYFSVIEIK